VLAWGGHDGLEVTAMHRCITLFLLMCVAVPLAEAAPKKGDDKPVLYLPTTVGDKFEHETFADGRSEVLTRWVTAVEQKGGVTTVSYGAEKGGPVLHRCSVSPAGVFTVSIGGEVYDPPLLELKLPARAGDSWEVAPPAKEGAAPRKYKYSTGAEEEVETPAGKFKARRVEREDIHGDVAFPLSLWYAPGMGVVKAVLHLESGDRTLAQLKSYTPATKK
jgi:hypothetical protein